MALFGNVSGTIATGDPTMRYEARKSRFVVSRYSREAGKYEKIIVKEHILIDFGSARHGWERFKKGKPYGLIVVPITQDLPEQPDDDYHGVGVLACILGSVGRVELIVDNDVVSDKLSTLYNDYEMSPEAAKGMVPLVDDWDIVEWVERKEKYFGKRLVPVPKAQSTDDEALVASEDDC